MPTHSYATRSIRKRSVPMKLDLAMEHVVRVRPILVLGADAERLTDEIQSLVAREKRSVLTFDCRNKAPRWVELHDSLKLLADEGVSLP